MSNQVFNAVTDITVSFLSSGEIEARYHNKDYNLCTFFAAYSPVISQCCIKTSIKLQTRDHTGKYKILVGKPEVKRPLGRPSRRWVDNIKIDLRERGWDGRDWIDLAQDRDRWRALVNTVMNLRVP
jgi:hypothetical protein